MLPAPKKEKEKRVAAGRTWTLVAWVLPALLIGGLYYVATRKIPDSSGPSLIAPDPRAGLGRMDDSDVSKVDIKIRKTTIGEIVSFQRPADLQPGRRVAPFETTLWKFEATIEEAELRSDGDIYLVISSPSGGRTVAELPPQAGGPFHDRIKATREQIERELKPSGQPKIVKRKAWLTGVGFFGRASKVSNGARLNPLVELEWID
jgi:hypothetical protein